MPATHKQLTIHLKARNRQAAQVITTLLPQFDVHTHTDPRHHATLTLIGTYRNLGKLLLCVRHHHLATGTGLADAFAVLTHHIAS